MQVITWGRRAFCCLHSSRRRSFHAGCVHLQIAPAGDSVPLKCPGESLQILYSKASFLSASFSVLPLSCMQDIEFAHILVRPMTTFLKPVFLTYTLHFQLQDADARQLQCLKGTFLTITLFCHQFVLQKERNFNTLPQYIFEIIPSDALVLAASSHRAWLRSTHV